MTFTLIILAILSMAILINIFARNTIENTIPMSASVMVLLLYLLAIIGKMKYIAVFSALLIVGTIAFFVFTSGSVLKKLFSSEKSDGDSKGFFECLPSGTISVFMLFIIIAAVTVLTSSQVFTWWDDINFWSSDAKQLFYLGGFPGKYGNVSPEFGDYPPATTIFKWIFLQLSPKAYHEAFQFAGYFAMNAIFLMPLVSVGRRVLIAPFGSEYTYDETGSLTGAHNTQTNVCTSLASACYRHRKTLTAIFVAFFAAVMLFPGVFSGIIYYGTPADITMAIIFGALLLAIWDKDVNSDFFYFARIALYTAVLMLTKSVAIEWAVFALIFYFVFGKKSKAILASIAVPAFTYASWLIFCLLNRRVAKLTGAGLRMAKSGYSLPQNAFDKFEYFIEGFFTMPMHADHNITLDLSTATAVIFIFILIIFLYKRNLVDKKAFIKLIVYTVAVFVLTYGIIFMAHVSIFQTEDQYLDAFAMANSLGRYGSPFTLGLSYLLIGIAITASASKKNESAICNSCSDSARIQKPKRSRLGWIVNKKAPCAVMGIVIVTTMIFLTANYSGVYKHLFGYRSSVSENTAYVADMVGDEGRQIIADISDTSLWGKRVLIVRDGHTYTWVHDTYISKEACPVALVYGTYMAENDTAETIANMIKSSHAHYVYVLDYDGASIELFSPLTEDTSFESGQVYRVEQSGEAIRLINRNTED